MLALKLWRLPSTAKWRNLRIEAPRQGPICFDCAAKYSQRLQNKFLTWSLDIYCCKSLVHLSHFTLGDLLREHFLVLFQRLVGPLISI